MNKEEWCKGKEHLLIARREEVFNAGREAERLQKNKMIRVFLNAALALGELKGSMWLDKHRKILLDEKEPEQKEEKE